MKKIKMLLPFRFDADRRRVVENFFSLSLLQVAKYVFPLITLPYLMRVLGPAKFGLIAFALAFNQYFYILTDYGFSFSATREVSIYRDDKERVSEIFSSVMFIKLGLVFVSLIIMTLFVFSVDKFRKEWEVFYLTFGMVIGQVLFPQWFFQGMERMRYITLLDVTARLIFTVAIFVFVHGTSDYIYVPLLNSFGFLTAGALAVRIIHKKFGVKFKFYKWPTLKKYLVGSWYIFASNLAGNIYGQGTILILGILSTNTVVGYYSAAEKLAKAMASLSQPIAQAIYPFVSKKDAKEQKRFILRFAKFLLPTISILAAAVFLFNKDIYIFVTGYRSYVGLVSFKVWTITAFFTFLNVVKQPFIYSLHMDKENLRMYLSVGLFFIPLCFGLTIVYGALGTSLSMLVIEFLILIWGIRIICNGFSKEECGF